MPLIVEIQPPVGSGGKWLPLSAPLLSGEAGSFSDNTDDGRREVYHFSCHADTAMISRSKGGVDENVGPMRLSYLLDGLEIIATLRDHETHTMQIKPDGQRMKVRVRFLFEKDEQ